MDQTENEEEEEEELLPGGNITAGVVRVGDTVRRPTSPRLRP